ncbi:NUDIX domain-containing protein [Paenibacillus sp. FA6]|uniref:NUDIX domain-containing protein n=1 Tax=Paenibacillus sp. FA6 TaxID=3413029 RepID=UPI003F660537
MRLIREIDDTVITREEMNMQDITFNVRKSSRAIVSNSSKQIAIIYVSKDKYHKLPGGGIEKGENYMSALNRELMEEAGVEVTVLGEIGMIIEYRKDHRLLQISNCYATEMIGELVEPSLTKDERSKGFVLKWVDLAEAISLLENDQPRNYAGKFIKERDLTFLKEAARMNE